MFSPCFLEPYAMYLQIYILSKSISRFQRCFMFHATVLTKINCILINLYFTQQQGWCSFLIGAQSFIIMFGTIASPVEIWWCLLCLSVWPPPYFFLGLYLAVQSWWLHVVDCTVKENWKSDFKVKQNGNFKVSLVVGLSLSKIDIIKPKWMKKSILLLLGCMEP